MIGLWRFSCLVCINDGLWGLIILSTTSRMLPFSLDCPYLIATLVFSNVYSTTPQLYNVRQIIRGGDQRNTSTLITYNTCILCKLMTGCVQYKTNRLFQNNLVLRDGTDLTSDLECKIEMRKRTEWRSWMALIGNEDVSHENVGNINNTLGMLTLYTW
jgi:hypothetical protein